MSLHLLLLGYARIGSVIDRSGFFRFLELDLVLVLVSELSISEGAGCVCVLHWGLDEVEWAAEDAVWAEFASLTGRECLGGFDSE